jgi:hypothetical protein
MGPLVFPEQPVLSSNSVAHLSNVAQSNSTHGPFLAQPAYFSSFFPFSSSSWKHHTTSSHCLLLLATGHHHRLCTAPPTLHSTLQIFLELSTDATTRRPPRRSSRRRPETATQGTAELPPCLLSHAAVKSSHCEKRPLHSPPPYKLIPSAGREPP